LKKPSSTAAVATKYDGESTSATTSRNIPNTPRFICAARPARQSRTCGFDEADRICIASSSGPCEGINFNRRYATDFRDKALPLSNFLATIRNIGNPYSEYCTMASLVESRQLFGFFSYSRDDDQGSKGALSALRAAIQDELSAQLGRTQADFLIWQDKTAISHGTLWENKISQGIDQAVFFIPIVTPRALRSQHCVFEFEAFLAREEKLGRDDLVFPILYIPVPELEDEKLWRQDPVLKIVGKRQYLDWRDLRPRGLD
jgi:hypothetical protein